jgi:hypothetical protein
MINSCWQILILFVRFEGLQYTNGRTMDITRQEGNPQALREGDCLHLLNQPITFFL